jgi:hypothetical protein
VAGGGLTGGVGGVGESPATPEGDAARLQLAKRGLW